VDSATATSQKRFCSYKLSLSQENQHYSPLDKRDSIVLLRTFIF